MNTPVKIVNFRLFIVMYSGIICARGFASPLRRNPMPTPTQQDVSTNISIFTVQLVRSESITSVDDWKDQLKKFYDVATEFAKAYNPNFIKLFIFKRLAEFIKSNTPPEMLVNRLSNIKADLIHVEKWMSSQIKDKEAALLFKAATNAVIDKISLTKQPQEQRTQAINESQQKFFRSTTPPRQPRRALEPITNTTATCVAAPDQTRPAQVPVFS